MKIERLDDCLARDLSQTACCFSFSPAERGIFVLSNLAKTPTIIIPKEFYSETHGSNNWLIFQAIL